MNDNENEVDASLGLFEAAIRAGKVQLKLPEVGRVKAVLDGSDQDATVLATTEQLGQFFSAKTSIESLEMSPDSDAGLRSARIAELAEDCDLLVLPVPFGEDIGSLKHESLSSVIDLTLAEIAKPMLLVRREVEEVASTLSQPVCLLEWHEDLQSLAAGWAALMAGGAGLLTMVVGYDPDLLDEIRAIFDDHADDRATFERLLERAVTRLAGGLVSAIQQLATERGFSTDFVNLGGTDLVSSVLGRCQEGKRLAVAAYRQGKAGPTLSRVRDLILGSDQPVLVLPS